MIRHARRRLCVDCCEPRVLLAADFAAQVTVDMAAVYKAHAADLDLDGDLDVLVLANLPDYKIAWYENTDGLGHFGPRRVVSAREEDGLLGSGLETVDIDGDDDLDLLVRLGSRYGWSYEGIAWRENTDGLGNFGPIQVIMPRGTEGTTNPPLTADVDADGDVDVLFYKPDVDALVWFENTDGKGHFGPEQVILSLGYLGAAYGPENIVTADLDSDGDWDIILHYVEPDPWRAYVVWFEDTDGGRHFGPERVITSDTGPLDWAYSIHPADLDGDGDLDVLVAFDTDFAYSKIAWYENTDGFGHFGPERFITRVPGGGGSSPVSVADLDNDGDLDVLFASWNGNKISWRENMDGKGTFGPTQEIDTVDAMRVASVYPADLDGDGDLDVLAASRDNTPTDNAEIAWYENLLPRIPGDANRDGFFDTADLVQVLQAGEYEDGIEDNSTWIEGDWDGDFDFGTSDLVLALQTGMYEVKPKLNASRIAAAVDWLFTQSDSKGSRRAFVA